MDQLRSVARGSSSTPSRREDAMHHYTEIKKPETLLSLPSFHHQQYD